MASPTIYEKKRIAVPLLHAINCNPDIITTAALSGGLTTAQLLALYDATTGHRDIQRHRERSKKAVSIAVAAGMLTNSNVAAATTKALLQALVLTFNSDLTAADIGGNYYED